MKPRRAPKPPRRWAIWRKTNGDCCYCSVALAIDYGVHSAVRQVSMDLDHAIPRTRGGSNHIDNLLPACQPCNNRKGVKTVEEFLAYERDRLGVPNHAFHPVAMAFAEGPQP